VAWFYLIVAGVLECVWALGLKYTQGFTRPVPSVITVAAMIASMWMLGVAVKTLPIGTAYAVWVGIGAVSTGVGGMVLLGEPVSATRIALLGVLVAIVKLSGMATIVPGPALWAFMLLTPLLTAVVSFDPRLFWSGSINRQYQVSR